MDSFKEKQNSECSVGGVYCPCCNPYKGKYNNHRKKQQLNRIVRAKMKAETQQIIKEDPTDNVINTEAKTII